MIDQISNLGVAIVAPPGSITATGNQGSSINLLTLQAVGMIGFILAADASTGSSSSILPFLQTAPDNATWTNVTGAAFSAVSDTANSGLQTLFVDSAVLNTYVRVSYTAAGSSPSVNLSLIAIFKVKNK